MVKKITLSLLVLLATVQAGKKRPLTQNFKVETQPMVKSYKKRNRVVKDDRHCGSYVTVEGSQSHPEVGAGACKALCLFQDDQNEWCFQTTSPALSVGWEWFQNTASNYYQISAKPYVQSQVNIKYWLQIIRLFQQ